MGLITLLSSTLLIHTASATQLSKTQIKELIHAESVEAGIDPDLALAVAIVESGLNPRAVSNKGAKGVMQLLPRYHNFREEDVRHNVRVGVQYLRYVRGVCRKYPGLSWVNCYCRGPYAPQLNAPEKYFYYVNVMKELNKIKVNRYLTKN